MSTQGKKYFVTGATGQQGGAVARRLLDKGQQIRVLTRNPDKAAALKERGAEVAVGDLADSISLDALTAIVCCGPPFSRCSP